ncbi:MAG: ABC transporter ATP-binding protein [Acidobacteriota bacterium]|nr:ABC transporter ATP-binding protein [Acidobacteriota bacterium]
MLAIRCRNLRKRYADVVAVDGLDLEVTRGECLGLLGPNGAGKTTTIEILEGLNRPDAGEVEVLGMKWGRDDAELRQRLGIQLQETQLNEKLTVEETLRLFRSFYKAGDEVEQVLARVQLEPKRTSQVGKLSGGQKQRLSVGCALVGKPDLLFLDEPTTGLDPQSRRQLWDLLEMFRRDGGTILLTTHYMDEAATLCDRVAIVDRGRVIAEGTPLELIRSLGAEHVLHFTTDGVEIPLAELQALAGVQGAARTDAGYSVTTSSTHQAVPALLQAIGASGAKLTMLNTHSATLEDVFMSLTGRHLRDE